MVQKQVNKGVGPELRAVLPTNGVPWYKQRHLIRLNFSIFCMVLFASANGYDGSMMNGLQALPQWQNFMNHPTGAWLGFINAVTSLGAVVFYPLSAWLCNKIGRKYTLWLSYFPLFLGVGLQTGARTPTEFVLGRLFLGGVAAFSGTAGPLLITETAYPTHRSILTAMYLTGWYVGSTIAAWATFGTRNYSGDIVNWAWRVPSLAQLAIPLFILPGVLTTPESPRWLVASGRDAEAKAFLTYYHSDGDENSPLVAFEMAEMTTAIEMERNIARSTSWVDMIRTKGNRHRSFISVSLGIFAQWNGVNVISYYLAPVLITVGITSVTQQTLISGFLNIWNLFIAVGAAFTVDFFGRRKLFFTSIGGMFVSYVIVTGLSGSFAQYKASATGIAVVPFLFTFYGFYDIAFTPLVLAYPCEIWPYELRARGLALTSISTQLAVSFNTFVNPIALENIAWKYYIIYIIILAVGGFMIYFFYPETNGHTLEEMAVVFDGDAANIQGPVEIAKGAQQIKMEVVKHDV